MAGALRSASPKPEDENPSASKLLYGDGYIPGVFIGRRAQKYLVINHLEREGYIPESRIAHEVEQFYQSLGIDNSYFMTEGVENIANNILSLYSAKMESYARKKALDTRFAGEWENHAVFFDSSEPGISVISSGIRSEEYIDTQYLNDAKGIWRLESFRSNEHKLRCYFLYRCKFVYPNTPEGENRLEVISDRSFLDKTTRKTRRLYQNVIDSVMRVTGPVIKTIITKRDELRLVVGFKRGSAMGLFAALSDLYHQYSCTSARKYVEHFTNGVTIVCVYIISVPSTAPNGLGFTHPEVYAEQIQKEVSLLYCIPQNLFQTHFMTGMLSLQEAVYAHCVCHFIGHFLNRFGTELTTLSEFLDPLNPAHAELIRNLKRRFSHETFNTDYIFKCINKYPDVVHEAYTSFESTHALRQALSVPLTDEELKALITTSVRSEDQAKILNYFIVFNEHMLKTNFYTSTKVALSFRFSPSFLPIKEYPQPLFGMFMVVGSEFRGFHLRFRDIARGGIRIVKSRNEEIYALNSRSVFDENYNLANTQHRKNKDIPESGAKGVILLDANQQDKEIYAFKKYIDAILDILLVEDLPDIKEPYVDLYGKQEILFMGPDENTAGLVDWATAHSKTRGAPFWKSFFTGKSARLGGMPHDVYGMTTLGVREYILGIYSKLNIDQTAMLKLQTGGPDGDLGSNEILLSSEKYGAIVDGSGVIVDPKGLNRDELQRLAEKRLTISNFNKKLLSDQGYMVLLEDSNLTLPDGEVVPNGIIFRNNFHLQNKLLFDVFIPCGGRPESINLSNVGELIVDGKSTIPCVVEGANLFISQEAKLRLEGAGTILIKDASANKGGVTSSSMEVLASLSFNDPEFTENMCVIGGITPPFYKTYVESVKEAIRKNARLEFEALWREKAITGKPFSVLSDEMSNAITNLDEEIRCTNLWGEEFLRRSVLKEALPACLVEKLGIEIILERVPSNYLQAIFSSYLASRFIYEHGVHSNQFAFFKFMREKITASKAEC